MKPLLSRLFLLACAALAPALPASAQDVVFSEGFESGIGAWTATGLWNLEDSTDPCGSQAAPFREGTKAAWYGSPTTCTFETGSSANSGTLTTNDWIQLPTAPSINLHYWAWSHSEYCWADYYGTEYDRFSVVITREVGSSITNFECGVDGLPASTLIPWHERQVDISAFSGLRVKISFQFGTGDQLSNNYLGWLIDNVRILAQPATRTCGPAGLISGCPCGPAGVPVAGGCRNSTQQSCTLFSSGTPSVTNDTILLRAENMPPVASAILTQSNGTGAAVPFADGLRCVSGGLMRMGAVTASGGVGTWPLPGESISVRGLIPAVGATKYYYVYYRDVQNYCTAATANLSDTRRIIWTP